MSTNDAAERLREAFAGLDIISSDLDAALAAERRATVERLHPYVLHWDSCGIADQGFCDCGRNDALDAEAER